MRQRPVEFGDHLFPRAHLDGLDLNVFRQVKEHGARTAGDRGVIGLDDERLGLLRNIGTVGGLGGFAVGDADDVDRLEGFRLGRGSRIARQGDHGAAIAVGIREAGDQVSGAGA